MQRHSSATTTAAAPRPTPHERDMELHNQRVDEMEANHAVTGRWIDPVSKREFPDGMRMKKNPNRDERRTLAHFRRTGKVKGRKGQSVHMLSDGKMR